MVHGQATNRMQQVWCCFGDDISAHLAGCRPPAGSPATWLRQCWRILRTFNTPAPAVHLPPPLSLQVVVLNQVLAADVNVGYEDTVNTQVGAEQKVHSDAALDCVQQQPQMLMRAAPLSLSLPPVLKHTYVWVGGNGNPGGGNRLP